jgi:hypothetical protein
MNLEADDVRRSADSEDNDSEYIDNSLMSELNPIGKESLEERKNLPMQLSHYRNIFEKCFKKNPLTFNKIFYSCGNKIINNFLRKVPFLREQDNKVIDYSKLNKTTGPGPINKILDKHLSLGDKPKENTKIVFIVFNNSSKKYEKYNLSVFSKKNIDFVNNNFSTPLSRLRVEYLSQVIKFVLTYRGGLESLYVYDTSCSVYRSYVDVIPDKIDKIIEALPPDIAK